jgi:hypothetical protein
MCARGFKPDCVIPDEKPRTLNRRSALLAANGRDNAMRTPIDFHPKPPYPPKPRLKRGIAKAMTAIAGFRYQDGILLCADSQLTHADGMKTTVEKIKTYGSNRTAVRAAVAGAGTEDCILAGFEQLDSRWPNIVAGQFDFAEVLNGVVKNVSGNYATKPEDDFALIACEWVEGASKPLRLLQAPSIVPGISPNFVSDGSGSVFLRFIADGLYDSSMSAAQAIIFAAYGLRLAKTYDLRCGGESKIFTLDTKGNMDTAMVWDIRALEQHFERFDAAIKSIVFPCADENVPDLKFGVCLQKLGENLCSLRSTRKMDIEDRIERFGPQL